MHQAAPKCKQNLFAVDNIRTAILRAGGEKKNINETQSGQIKLQGIWYCLQATIQTRRSRPIIML